MSMFPTTTSAVLVRAGSVLCQAVAPVAASSEKSSLVLSATKTCFAAYAGDGTYGSGFNAPAGTSRHTTAPLLGSIETTSPSAETATTRPAIHSGVVAPPRLKGA